MTNPAKAVTGYFKSIIEEGKKVIWPSRDMIFRHSVLVVATIGVAMAVFASVDYGLQQLVLKVVNK